jgi:transcriptional regulator with GAF, ATPase, and Fis domain
MTNQRDELRLISLIDLAQVLGQQNDYQEILRLVAQKASQLVEADYVLLLMINPRTRETMKTMFKEGLKLDQRRLHSIQTHVSGWIVKNKQAFESTDIGKDPRFKKNLFKQSEIKTVLGVPLRIEGLIIGTLLLLKKQRAQKTAPDELIWLEKLAAIATPYLRNLQKIQQYFETKLPKNAILAKYEQVGLRGRSENFVELLRAVEAAANSEVRVLLEGESGTGKELLAKAIHQFSERNGQPFVAIDCGAIPGHLLESELFGHAKGAFTGATTNRKGLFQEAHGGTLFMDEIANLPLDMQTKLMRVLQEGEIRPLGSNKSVNVDVRIISASSSSLKRLVAEERFRQDLYFRLYVYPVYVPTLHERCEDIPLLANHFLEQFADQQRKKTQCFDGRIIDFMKARAWHGHIRELQNLVERLVTLAPKDMEVLEADILPADLKKEMKITEQSYSDDYYQKSLSDNVADLEEQLIRKALLGNNWNQSRAARALKVPVQTIRYKMEKLGIKKPV